MALPVDGSGRRFVECRAGVNLALTRTHPLAGTNPVGALKEELIRSEGKILGFDTRCTISRTGGACYSTLAVVSEERVS